MFFPNKMRDRAPDARFAAQLELDAAPDDAERLLVDIARVLRAFYGAAKTSAPSEFILVRGEWIGIPPIPSRLVWLGEPYSKLAASSEPAASRDGVVLRSAAGARLPIAEDLQWHWLDNDALGRLEADVRAARAPVTAQELVNQLTLGKAPAQVLPDV